MGDRTKFMNNDGDYILVAGAGPAGLSCAYWAAREGYSVTVYEKEGRLATKPCGEMIPEEALRHTPFTDKATWIFNRVERCMLYFNGKFIREVSMPPLTGYVIDKGAFLNELKEAAEAEGALIHLRKRAAYQDLVNAKPDLIVDATGYASVLGKAAGLDHSNYELIPTMQTYCKGELPPDAIVVNLYDRGYAWLFPRGDLINFGVGGFYWKQELEKHFRNSIKTFGLKPTSFPIRRAAGNVGGPLNHLRKGNLVVAGEAAGTVMPTTGEGIRFALWSGSICFKEDYEELFWRGYGKRLKFSRELLQILLKLGDDVKLELLRDAPQELLLAFFDGAEPSWARFFV